MSQSPSPPMESARRHHGDALERLMQLVAIPSVSAVPEHKADVARAAEWVAAQLSSAGLDEVRVDKTPGHPIVYGQWMGRPDAPTVLFYGHYDVQPPDPLELWHTPPFQPTVVDGNLYGRGASDDKGQFLLHIEALRAFHDAGGGPPVNVRMIIEGEEEVGSPNLEAYLAEHTDDLGADVAVISDTAMSGPNQPSIVYGLRGLAYFQVTVRGPKRDLHSGQYGGAVINPANALAAIIAGLHDDQGRVAIPGYYDAVQPLGDDERAELARTPFDVAAYRGAVGEAGEWGEPGYSVVERLGARPTLDVNGMWSGWTGAGAKTVIPAEAHAKISMRLVPDQEPDHVADLFARHVHALAPPGLTLTIESLHGARPVVIDRDHPAIRAAAQAYGEIFGVAPVYTREGGSIPIVESLQRILGHRTVLMGFGLPDDNLHAPNEKFAIRNFERGIETMIDFLERLPRALG